MQTSPVAHRNELTSAAVYGLVIALAISLGWLLLLFPEMPGNSLQCPRSFLACLVPTVATTAGVVGLARLPRVLRVSVWLAVRHGAVQGAVAGAASMCVGTLLGTRVGTVFSIGEVAYLNTAPAPTVFRHGLGGGMPAIARPVRAG